MVYFFSILLIIKHANRVYAVILYSILKTMARSVTKIDISITLRAGNTILFTKTHIQYL